MICSSRHENRVTGVARQKKALAWPSGLSLPSSPASLGLPEWLASARHKRIAAHATCFDWERGAQGFDVTVEFSAAVTFTLAACMKFTSTTYEDVGNDEFASFCWAGWGFECNALPLSDGYRMIVLRAGSAWPTSRRCPSTRAVGAKRSGASTSP